MNHKIAVHFADKSLLQPANPVLINIIGAGGTGSQVLTAMARINHSLIALAHPGLWVQLFDDDRVTPANLGRQLFAESELGFHKAVALINRVNRFFGTNWKAVTKKYNRKNAGVLPHGGAATITISCVDTVAARFEIAGMISQLKNDLTNHAHKPVYWMDFGNSQYSGQVILATVGSVRQPASKMYQTVEKLPSVTDEYKELLTEAETTDDTPSCSLADALTKQDLFINTVLANMGASLLWNFIKTGMTENRGFFVNLKDFKTQALKVQL